jgi:hypothetical protein
VPLGRNRARPNRTTAQRAAAALHGGLTAVPTGARESAEERGGSPARGRRRGMTATGERRGGMATDRTSAASDRGGWDGGTRGKASGGQREAVGRAASGARRAGGRPAVPTAAACERRGAWQPCGNGALPGGPGAARGV